LKRPWTLPLVPLYATGCAMRSAALRLGLEQIQRLAGPVISVGSLSAGGAGKTPFVIALARLLKAENIPVDVLSRGYGRAGSDPAFVKADGDAAVYGDEPLLIVREAGVPVYVGARRYEAGLLAEKSGSGTAVHLLDDGFQHRQLARNADIVLVSTDDLHDRLLPAGNRREPLSALKRADVLAVPSEDDAAVERLRVMGLKQPVWRFRREMDVPKIDDPTAAFCGIARPEQFFTGLERAGVTLAARHAFADHHRFDRSDTAMLMRLARHSGARGFVTTAKDHVRLGSLVEELATPLNVAGLRTIFEDEASVAGWLRKTISIARDEN
jgi:tetraacyldisaccharide 4'-kinase